MTASRYSCDECGRQMVKTHRLYREHRYCANCYKREFPHRVCSRCGGYARIWRRDLAAVCHKCENDQPCVRCRKTSYTVGKITIYGPVCNACSPYFRKQEHCEVCGVLSFRLTRSNQLEHDRRVCPRCATVDHGTCHACRRYRKLQVGVDGQLLCRKCDQYGERSCIQCKEPMPAGYGNRCVRCYWKGVLEKRVRLDCAAFSTCVVAEHFTAFGQWLLVEVGEQKSALTIHRYLQFFREIEQQWGDIPGYDLLLRRFGTGELRRVLLPMRWIETVGLATSNKEAKTEDSERRRIAVIQQKFSPGSNERMLLDNYLQMLFDRLAAGRTTLASVRLALTPAAGLLSSFRAGDQERLLPGQKELNAYLANKPGQRAAISGFVRFLREVYNAEVRLPKANQAEGSRLRRKNQEAELLALMRDGDGSEPCRLQWVTVALAYFHGLDRNIGQKALKTGFAQVRDGLVITWNNRDYWLPVPAWWLLE